MHPLFNRLAAAFACLGLSCPAQAVDFEARWPIVAYSQYQALGDNPVFNPDNRVYAIARREDHAEFRPELRVAGNRLSLDLSPRLLVERSERTTGGVTTAEREEQARLRYARLQYTGQSSAARVGRYVNLWGPSVFVSPSNPFHLNSGQASPQIELRARDYAELSHQFDDQLSMQLIANLGDGDQGIDDFQRSTVLKLDYAGARLSNSVLLHSQAGAWALGDYGQWTVDDALLLYWDGGWRRGRQLAAYPGAAGLGPDPRRTGTLDALLGAAYSFESGTTVGLEFYRNGSGLSEAERQRAFALGALAVSRLPDAAQRSAAARTIGALAGVPFMRMGRRYAMARLQRNNLWGEVNVSLLHTRNLDDRSSQTVLNLDWYVHDKVQLFANTALFDGSRDSEYGRFIERQVSIGLRWTPW